MNPTELHLFSGSGPDQGMRSSLQSSRIQLTVTRDLIATIISVRRPRKKKRPMTQPRKRRIRILHHTNQHIFSRVSSHQGELRGFIPGQGWVRLQKRAVCQLLREAGRSAPAIVTLTVRQGVGYLRPVKSSPVSE